MHDSTSTIFHVGNPPLTLLYSAWRGCLSSLLYLCTASSTTRRIGRDFACSFVTWCANVCLLMFSEQHTFIHVFGNHATADSYCHLVQAYQGLCAATGRTPQDQEAAVHQLGAEATRVQIGLAGKDPHPGYSYRYLQSSKHCG